MKRKVDVTSAQMHAAQMLVNRGDERESVRRIAEASVETLGFEGSIPHAIDDMSGDFEGQTAEIQVPDLGPEWRRATWKRESIVGGQGDSWWFTDDDQGWFESVTAVRNRSQRSQVSEVRITDTLTGGQKGQKQEQYGLIPVWPLAEVARVYGYGAQKYEPNNWRKGYAWTLSYDACLRHIQAFWSGEQADESGFHHLAHAAFHLFALMHYSQEGVGTDDRPSSPRL